MLNLDAKLLIGTDVVVSGLTTETEAAVAAAREWEQEWEWSGDNMEWELSGRLRKMEGEKVRLREDLSLAMGERNPALWGAWWGGFGGAAVVSSPLDCGPL